MRNSRIMAIMIVICFTVSGASVVWGKEKECKYKHDTNKKVFVITDDNGKFEKFKIDGAEVPEDIAGYAYGMILNFGGNAGEQKVIEVEDGSCIFTGSGTCASYFYGGTWHQKCW